MRISQDFWDEFMLWARVCYYMDSEADVYDVFMRMRTEDGNQPFSASLINQIDFQILKEEIRNRKKLQE